MTEILTAGVIDFVDTIRIQREQAGSKESAYIVHAPGTTEAIRVDIEETLVVEITPSGHGALVRSSFSKRADTGGDARYWRRRYHELNRLYAHDMQVAYARVEKSETDLARMLSEEA